jgi:hypothetical protein
MSFLRTACALPTASEQRLLRVDNRKASKASQALLPAVAKPQKPWRKPGGFQTISLVFSTHEFIF